MPAYQHSAQPSFLITGGTGFLGQRLVRYLLDHLNPRRVLIFSRDEYKQSVLAKQFPDSRLRWVLGDVRDRERLEMVLGGVDVVIHTAALKRVDAIAYNPSEVLATNILGTKNVCMAAIAKGVQTVITVSSDKAVEPTNTYGCSKQMAEHLTSGANVHGVPQGTRSASVRYGNVLGSRGSVIGIFRDAVAAKRPLEITDLRMSRFWLDVEQACEIIHYAMTHLTGGEIFVPKLKTTTIVDLARLIGGVNYPTKLVGLRKGGEKLAEVMLSAEEISRTYDQGAYYVVAPEPHPWTASGITGTLVAPDLHYSSETAPRLSDHELYAMLANCL